MLKWDDIYKLGNVKIDAEHRIFLELIIEFQEAVVQSRSKDKLITIVKEISKYAEFHFLSEENIMAEYNYPEQEQHTQIHKMLISEIHDKLYQLINGEINPVAIFNFLFQWFAFHTTTEDKKLVGHIKNGSWTEDMPCN
jgi:hemerythrin